ncbi:MAG: response regulator transcription factor [Lachnospiraceae bacterium]|nr:response regulator transcription factor [Lachnospiraceae bacterium]
MKKKILMIDDDKDLSAIVADMLRAYNYEVELVTDCEQAFDILKEKQFHLILLDINLPDGDGFYVCRELRQVSQVPVIFASARTREDDKITGLDIGGDDYVEKPYSLKELLARVKALMRRTYHDDIEAPVYEIGDIKIDTGKRTVWKDGEEVKLALKEFDVLNFLCVHMGQTVSKEDILHEVWGAFSEAEIATVAVHIRWLREKLEQNSAQPALIKTVWGIGYRLECDEKLDGE